MSVIAVLALAAAVLVPNVFCTIGCDPEQRRWDAARNLTAVLGGLVECYAFEARALPPDLQALTAPSPKLGEPYLHDIPRDPWGNAYRYRVEDPTKSEYEIRSAGPDERFDTDDDLVYLGPTPR